MAKQKQVLVVLHNHFDPIWRRCWDRTFEFQGKKYHPYSELEEYIIKDWLSDAAEFGAVISEGQAAVMRKFVERNPDRLPELRERFQQGRLELTAGGEVVPDTNMPGGESLVRNYLYGLLWFEQTFGGWTKVCTLEDSFGSSAQLPQILRGFGIPYVINLSYKWVFGDYWKGLDGTVICKRSDFLRGWIGSNYKYPPCDACAGNGCEKCEQTGFLLGDRISEDSVYSGIGSMNLADWDWGIIGIGGEEHMPCRSLGEAVRRAKEDFPDREVIFAGYGEVLKRIKKFVDLTDEHPYCAPEVEGNPSSCGCQVTRIRTKQRFRELEHSLLTTEKLCALMYAWGEEYPGQQLVELWRPQLFTAFHDAITATHINAAYVELMDMFDQVEQGTRQLQTSGMQKLAEKINLPLAQEEQALLLFNPLNWERTDPMEVTLPAGAQLLEERGAKSVILERSTSDGGDKLTLIPPAVPALGYRVLKFVVPPSGGSESVVPPLGGLAGIKVGENFLENKYLRVVFDSHGIRRVVDRELDAVVLEQRPWRVNELLLEEDVGDPWGTMKAPEFLYGLEGYTTASWVDASSGLPKLVVEGRYQDDDPGVKYLSWRQETWLVPGRREIEFRTVIDWDTRDRRIRVGMPTLSRETDAWYEIPYGTLRRPQSPAEYRCHNGWNGDWATIHWAEVHAPEHDYGVALLNRGNPSYKVLDGVIYMSLLRSPADSWCLNEPEFYDCPDFDGALDQGKHEFRYKLCPHPGDWRGREVVRRGWEFNAPMLSSVTGAQSGQLPAGKASLLSVDDPQVVVTTLKKAERDDRLILRAYETSGQPASAKLTTRLPVKGMAETNLYETAKGKKVNRKQVDFHSFEIKTLAISLKR